MSMEAMYGPVARLLDILDRDRAVAEQAIRWSCPVPFFGRIDTARLATVGINPSNREFVDFAGAQLRDCEQRFPTLGSLRLSSWGHADFVDLRSILEACQTYFDRNPYGRWFGPLERLLGATGCSYYSPRATACHIDIVPWATTFKWGSLGPRVRHGLVERTSGALIDLIAHSSLTMLVLNGQEVVRRFEALIDHALPAELAPEWDLPRENGTKVRGIAYCDVLTSLGGRALDRELVVVGYNHNVQSSFGVTSVARCAISEWISDQYAGSVA